MDAPASSQSDNARSEAAGVFAMTLATFGFSWGFIIVRAVGLPPAWTALFRLGIGAATLVGASRLLRAPMVVTRWVVLAGLCFGLHQLLFIEASQVTSIALVTLIGAMQPVLVAMISQRTVGERVPRALWGCGLLAIAGVGAVVFANRAHPSTSLYGLVVCVLNLFAFTAFFLTSKRARLEGAHPVSLTGVSLGVALLPILPMLASEVPETVQVWQVALLALMALVPGNGHLLVNWAHPRVSAALGSIVLALVPVFASIWARLFFGEPYGAMHVLGTLLCLAAVELGRRATSNLGAARPG